MINGGRAYQPDIIIHKHAFVKYIKNGFDYVKDFVNYKHGFHHQK